MRSESTRKGRDPSGLLTDITKLNYRHLLEGRQQTPTWDANLKARWRSVAVAAICLLAGIVGIPSSPADAQTSTCTGGVYSNASMAKANFEKDCGSPFQETTEFKCDWVPASNGNPSGFRCTGPGDQSGGGGGVGKPVTPKRGEGTPAPTNLRIKDGLLAWDPAPSGTDVAKYNLFRNGELWKSIPNSGGFANSPWARMGGTPAIWRVQAVSANGTQREFSNYIGVNDGIIGNEGFHDPKGYDQTNLTAFTENERHDFLAARVGYNRAITAGKTDTAADFFNDYSPVRMSLNSAERNRYDQAVNEMSKNLSRYGRELNAPGQRMDASLRYLLASTLVEAFWPNTHLAQVTLTAIKNRWFVQYNRAGAIRGSATCNTENVFGDHLAGIHPKGHVYVNIGDIVIASMDRKPPRRGNSRPYIQELTVVHEAAHVIVCENHRVTLSYYSFYNYMKKQWEDSGRRDTGGLSAYAYTNIDEFFAEAVSYFTHEERRKILYERAPLLYNWVRTTLQQQSRVPEAPIL